MSGYYEAAGRDTGITSIVHNTGITSILPESSSICNTGTDTGTSILQNLPVSAILIFWQ
jgi:hypothetical protein